MSGPWTFTGEIAALGSSTDMVMLVEETTFCVSDRSGDIHPGTAQGLILLDTRFLGGLRLLIDGRPVESLGVATDEPFHATFLGRVVPTTGEADGPLVAVRHRSISRGLAEAIHLENHGTQPIASRVELLVDVDFADLFEVKEQRPTMSRVTSIRAGEGSLCFDGLRNGIECSVEINSSPPGLAVLRAGGGQLLWEAAIPPQDDLVISIRAVGCVNGEKIEPRFDEPGSAAHPAPRSSPRRRLGDWRAAAPGLATDDERLDVAVRRGVADLGALRITDPDEPSDTVVAAGAPWFMTLFGRDSLLTSYMALILDPKLALGVVRTLARLQGERVDARTEEEPGRIIHELRFDRQPSWRFADATRYYGTVDATPLFVMLLGELRRWGLADGDVEALMPAADAAVRWIEDFGDRDGDGFIEYERSTDRGLQNQGWKDSWDAIRFADGRLAKGPIALAEVQGYVYAAYLARAHFADQAGDVAQRDRLRARASDLRERFNDTFWLDAEGCIAMALDGDKVAVDAVSSNMGHCLWCGILDLDRAASVADRLLADDMFSGWGIRTMSSSAAGYNPVSYHNGSVWPHDNALIAAGLMRYGFVDHAHRVIDAMLDVSTHFGGRLPELLAGIGRAELSVPAVYPTSCLPQAWAAAAPLLFLRTMLRLDPWIPHEELWLDPKLGRREHVRLERIPLAGSQVNIDATGDGVTVEGLPPAITVHHVARAPLADPG